MHTGIEYEPAQGQNQIIDTKVFNEIETAVLYELYSNNLSFANSEMILDLIKDRLKYRVLNYKVELKSKDKTILELKSVINNKELYCNNLNIRNDTLKKEIKKLHIIVGMLCVSIVLLLISIVL